MSHGRVGSLDSVLDVGIIRMCSVPLSPLGNFYGLHPISRYYPGGSTVVGRGELRSHYFLRARWSGTHCRVKLSEVGSRVVKGSYMHYLSVPPGSSPVESYSLP